MPAQPPACRWRRLGLALAFGLACAHACAREGAQARCEDDGERGSLSFSSRDDGYRVDHSLSYRTLTQMKRPGGNGFVLGLTRAESRVAVRIEGTVVPSADGRHECLLPHIGVTLSYQPIVVYIGREFAQDSCAYREILAHELRHLDAYTGYLPRAEERIRAAMARRMQGKAVYAPAGQSLRRVEAEINRNWMPFIKREMGRAKGLQSAIDSPHEYARLSKVCQGEVQSLIGSTRGSAS